MSNAKQEILSIKRDSNDIDGQVLNFLKTDPISPGSTLADAVMVTLKAHWLPMVLYSMGVRGEKLRLPTLWALQQLEAQAKLIRRICEIDNSRWNLIAVLAKLLIDVTSDRVLNKLKVGKQSTAGKAIDAFIKELITKIEWLNFGN